MKRLRKLLTRLLRVFLALVMIVMVAEVLSRIKLYHRTKDLKFFLPMFVGFKKVQADDSPQTIKGYGTTKASSYYKMLPGIDPVSSQGARAAYRINSLGFRGPDFSPDNKSGR